MGGLFFVRTVPNLSFFSPTLIFTLLLLVVLLPVFTFAFQNSPDGFRGIPWGAKISTLPDMIPVKPDEELLGPARLYVRKNDNPRIAEAGLEKIVYRFFNGQLRGVTIDYAGHQNHEKLKETFRNYLLWIAIRAKV